MTNTKHTPGPWHFRALPDDCHVVESRAWNPADGGSAANLDVCDGQTIHVYGKQAAADAALIAAAPDLLAALQDLTAQVTNYINSDECELPDVTAALAAVAKAVKS
jgi:hypothetical protein